MVDPAPGPAWPLHDSKVQKRTPSAQDPLKPDPRDWFSPKSPFTKRDRRKMQHSKKNMKKQARCPWWTIGDPRGATRASQWIHSDNAFWEGRCIQAAGPFLYFYIYRPLNKLLGAASILKVKLEYICLPLIWYFYLLFSRGTQGIL